MATGGNTEVLELFRELLIIIRPGVADAARFNRLFNFVNDQVQSTIDVNVSGSVLLGNLGTGQTKANTVDAVKTGVGIEEVKVAVDDSDSAVLGGENLDKNDRPLPIDPEDSAKTDLYRQADIDAEAAQKALDEEAKARKDEQDHDVPLGGTADNRQGDPDSDALKPQDSVKDAKSDKSDASTKTDVKGKV